MIDNLFIIFLTVLAIAIFISPIYLLRRFIRRRSKKIGKPLSVEDQEKFKGKQNAEAINGLTVILPMAIFITLSRSYDFLYSLVISLCVGFGFRFIIYILQKRNK